VAAYCYPTRRQVSAHYMTRFIRNGRFRNPNVHSQRGRFISLYLYFRKHLATGHPDWSYSVSERVKHTKTSLILQRYVRLNDEWAGTDDLVVILEGKQQYLRTISALLGYWRSFPPLQSLDIRTQGILPPMKLFKYSYGGEFPPNLQARLSVLERELSCDVYHITHDTVTLVSHEKLKPIRTFRSTSLHFTLSTLAQHHCFLLPPRLIGFFFLSDRTSVV
jgi:hypothetical protein